jgi:hypothetical protein
MPAAIRPLASAATWSRNSPAVTAAQPAPDLRRNTTVPGSRSARSKTVSVQLAAAGTSTSTGTLYSRTCSTLLAGQVDLCLDATAISFGWVEPVI